MDFYAVTVPQLIRTLGNLDRWLVLAAAHPEGDKLLAMRLAPDQFTLTRQVQTAADNAKMMSGRLAGKEWPSHPDIETTYEQLRARLASVVDFLASFTADDFADSGDRKIKLPWMKDSEHLLAADYVVQFALPNFYFHVVTAYAILRHAGLPIGKQEFMGELSIRT